MNALLSLSSWLQMLVPMYINGNSGSQVERNPWNTLLVLGQSKLFSHVFVLCFPFTWQPSRQPALNLDTATQQSTLTTPFYNLSRTNNSTGFHMGCSPRHATTFCCVSYSTLMTPFETSRKWPPHFYNFQSRFTLVWPGRSNSPDLSWESIIHGYNGAERPKLQTSSAPNER